MTYILSNNILQVQDIVLDFLTVIDVRFVHECRRIDPNTD